jgi:hypothetical protein
MREKILDYEELRYLNSDVINIWFCYLDPELFGCRLPIHDDFVLLLDHDSYGDAHLEEYER